MFCGDGRMVALVDGCDGTRRRYGRDVTMKFIKQQNRIVENATTMWINVLNLYLGFDVRSERIGGFCANIRFTRCRNAHVKTDYLKPDSCHCLPPIRQEYLPGQVAT